MVEALISIFLDESTWTDNNRLSQSSEFHRYCVIGSSVRTTKASLPKAVERNRFPILTQTDCLSQLMSESEANRLQYCGRIER